MILTLHINDEGSVPVAVGPDELEEAVRVALAEGPREGGRVGTAEIGLTLLGREEMRELAHRYGGADEPTDVLAFALDPEPGPAPHGGPAEAVEPGPGDGPEGRPAGAEGVAILGDIYLCPAVAAESAEAHGIELREELLRLAIHGVLHLLGHDHPEGEERYGSEMFALQERLLASLSD